MTVVKIQSFFPQNSKLYKILSETFLSARHSFGSV